MSDRIQITSPFSKLVYEGETGDRILSYREYLPVKKILSILPKVQWFNVYVPALEGEVGILVKGNKKEVSFQLRECDPDQLVVCHLKLFIDPEDGSVLDEELTIGES